jgi:hypothetical protein
VAGLRGSCWCNFWRSHLSIPGMILLQACGGRVLGPRHTRRWCRMRTPAGPMGSGGGVHQQQAMAKPRPSCCQRTEASWLATPMDPWVGPTRPTRATASRHLSYGNQFDYLISRGLARPVRSVSAQASALRFRRQAFMPPKSTGRSSR